MKKIQPVNPVQRQEFLAWYHASSSGRALQTLESAYLDSEIELTYNSHTLQVGGLGLECVYVPDDARGKFALLSDGLQLPPSPLEQIRASAGALPIASESIDTLILAHVLEFEPDRHQVLREAGRVLKPEGKLVILGLNPLHPRRWLWNAKPVPGWQLLDWLSLLNFDAHLDTCFGKTTRYAGRDTPSFWKRFRSGLATGYAVKAIKRSYRLIPIEPDWVQISRMVTGGLLETTQYQTHDDHDRSH